jgi:hypothetical protein
MKPLLTLKDDAKATFFNLQVYDMLDKIEKRCAKWLHGVFVEVYVPEYIETSNLCMDLNYMFTQCIWLIEQGEQYGEINSIDFVERMYNDYTSSKDGYKKLMDSTYNITEHRLFTAEEITANQNRGREIMMELLNEL